MLAMTGRIILGTFLIIAIGLFIAVKFDVEEIPPSLPKARQNIEITLPQKIDSNNGEWGDYKNKALQDSKEVKEGSVKIHLPSGRLLSYEVAYGYMCQTNETLDTINLNLLPGTYDYQEAIDKLEKELKELSVENKQECVSGLEKLRAEKNPDRYLDIHPGYRVEIEQGVELLAGLARFSIPTPKIDTLKPNLGFATILKFSLTQQQQQYCCEQN